MKRQAGSEQERAVCFPQHSQRKSRPSFWQFLVIAGELLAVPFNRNFNDPTVKGR